MMASSIIEKGASLKVDILKSPNSIPNVTLHDPDVETSPASPTTAGYMDGDPSDDLEEARNSSNKLQRSFSLVGKQLAESSTLGSRAEKSSDFPSELSVSTSSVYSEDSFPELELTGGDANIALSQLQELEVAIKVRKGTKIDGRKTRWDIYRKEKGCKQSNSNSESVGNISSGSESGFIGGIEDQKPDLKLDKKVSSNKKSFKVKQLKAFARKKSKSDYVKSEENLNPVNDSSENIYSINNNSNIANNYNHKNISPDNMKVEDVGPVLGPIETNNVLETMKQQFLEGTCNISESAPPTPKTKKKSKKNEKNISNDENVKRKPGRPKKKESKLMTSTPKPEVSSIDLSSSINNEKVNDSYTTLSTETVTPKKESLVGLPMSPDFYLKKNPVTRGLREVRKSESGSESNSSTPVKDTSLHLQLSPATSPPLALSPNTLSPLKYENTNGATKFSLIRAAKALNDYDFNQQSSEESKKTKYIRKTSKKENILVQNKISPQKLQTENGESQDDVPPISQICTKTVEKKVRGRKRKFLKNSWPEKTSMVVADVHNSMNGEPQALINTSVGRKKKMPPKKKNETANTVSSTESLLKNSNHVELLSNKENSIRPTVPSLNSPQRLPVSAISALNVNTPTKIVSKSTNSNVKSNHLNLENRDSPPKSSNSTTMEPSKTLETYLETTSDKLNHSHNGSIVQSELKNINAQKNFQATIKNTASDQKHKSISENTTGNSLSKGKLYPNCTSSKCHSKYLSDSIQNDAQLSETNCTNILSKSNEICTSVDESHAVPSPQKTLNAFSPDKQRKDKYAKNKSLNAVIEKLQKPTVDGIESEIRTSNNPMNEEKQNNIHCELNGKNFSEQPLTNSETFGKVKKTPKFLKSLFMDEGVQLMLGSMEDGTNVEAGQHKLRPKRINDNIAESPEPEESLQKRRKRPTEVDNLYVDEGTLNLLTSIESTNRRPSLSDDNSLEQLKTNKTIRCGTVKVAECKKRKLSGNKSELSVNKRLKLNVDGLFKPAVTSEGVKKKVGRPSNADLLKKKQLQEYQSGVQINPPKEAVQNLASEKSLPSLKIRLPQNEEILSKPTINQSDQVKLVKSHISPMNCKPTKTIPPVQEAEPKKLSPTLPEVRPVLINNQPRVRGVPLKKLLPAGALKTMKIGLIKPLNKESQSQKIRPRTEIVRQSLRASVRNNEVNNHFRDIHLRKFNHFMHIIFNPSTTKMKNAFNSGVLRELCEALNYIKKEPTVNLVLLTSTGSTFCQGVDLTSLQHSNIEIRKKNATNLTRAIKEFLHCLITFPKVIIAGINGTAIGLGVTMLPLFDLVFASEKAEFYLPYGELGQVPEGGATYTFPQNYGKLQSNKLFMGKKITACQAQEMGMVSESLFHNTFLQELIPKVAVIATNPSSGMEATKALMNHHLLTKLELSVETECRALLQQWGTANFTIQCKRYLESTYVLYQVPAFRQSQ